MLCFDCPVPLLCVCRCRAALCQPLPCHRALGVNNLRDAVTSVTRSSQHRQELELGPLADVELLLLLLQGALTERRCLTLRSGLEAALRIASAA